MNAQDAVRRLRAFHAGKPLPCGETKRFHIAADKDLLLLAFVRMGGESRPWGMAFGRPGRKPTVLTVPEARNRDLVAGMAVRLVPTLLKHMRHPDYVSKCPDSWEDLQPLKQVWLPNVSHLDMLHHLAFSYSWTRHGGVKRLRELGRACGWLFREAQRPGQMKTMVATKVLREAYTFPAEDIRQGHLGFLLAWLGTRGGIKRRMQAALEAERNSMSASLDPDLERKELSPLVEEVGAADKEDNEAARKRAARKIHQLLAAELQARWALLEAAITQLREDKRHENNGIEKLVEATLTEQWYQYIRLELRKNDEEDGPAFFPSAETDRHPAAAASRYQVYRASAELVESLLVHDDRELLAEAIAGGEAIQGEIVEVEDIGSGKSTRPVWTIEDAAQRQLRLRVGSRVAAVGFRGRQGVVRSINVNDEGHWLIQVEIDKLKTARKPGPGIHSGPPNSKVLEGSTAAFVSAPSDGISRSKSFKMWDSDGPGAWLTHAQPGGVRALVREGDADDVAEVDKALKEMDG